MNADDMNASKAELILKFNQGVLTADEQLQLEKMIEKNEVALEELEGLNQLHDQILAIKDPLPPIELDSKFYGMLAAQKPVAKVNWWQHLNLAEWMPRLSLAAVMVLIGISIGYFLRPAQPEADLTEIKKLGDEVTTLKEMMMLSLLEKESATERLKAVSLTQDMDQASQKVTAALLETLNKDENVNVRLAALDALRPYVKDSNIRQELIRSIAVQKSPLVQIALAELMAAIQEKSSVQELQKVLKDKKTPRDVRKKIEESINVLI